MPTLRVRPSSDSASASSSRTSSSFCSRSASSGSIARASLQRDQLARLERDQLGDAVAEQVRQVEHAADVAHRRLRGHRAEGRDLRHRLRAVLLLDVVDDAVAAVLAEVDVEVRHRHALGIEEALEQQPVAQRIEIGDAERVGDERAGAGAAAGTDRHAVALRPVDEVGDDQEVAGEAHLDDRSDLEVETRGVLGATSRRARPDRGRGRASRRSRPAAASPRRWSSSVTPGGVGKSGR